MFDIKDKDLYILTYYMVIMTNINEIVWKTLDNSPCIKRNMSCGLINTRALASYIIREKQINGNVDAVISAIRRYKIEKYSDIFIKAHNLILQTTDLSTRSNLTNIALIKDKEIQELIPRFFSVIEYPRGDVLRIIQADESIKVLINEKNLKKITDLIPKNKIITIDKDLAEINLHLDPNAKSTPGVIATITNELAINGVSIVEVLTCFPEMLWFVEQKELLKAYAIVYQLCRP